MTFWDFLMIAAVLVVLYTLIMGMVQLVRLGEEARKKSNKWMWRRIWAQAIAIVVLFFAAYMKAQGGS